MSRKKILNYILLVVILGLAVNFLLPKLATIEKSLLVLKSMNWFFVILAFTAQAFSYLSTGYLIKAILKTYNREISVYKSAVIYLCSTSIGLVAGGILGSSAAIYKWLKKEDMTKNSSTIISVIPSMLNTGIIMVITTLGVVYLIFFHDILSNTQLIEYGIILLLLVTAAVIIFLALKHKETVIKIITGVEEFIKNIFHKPFSPEKTIEYIDNIYTDINSLNKGRFKKPLIGGISTVIFDILTLYFMFLAAGYNISLGVLLSGYGLPLLLGKMAFIIPGGIGIVETTMLGLYTGLGIPSATCAVVILGYRLISFWIPTISGFAGIPYLDRRTDMN